MADEMRRRRARFECELKRCKAKEVSLRSERLTKKTSLAELAVVLERC